MLSTSHSTESSHNILVWAVKDGMQLNRKKEMIPCPIRAKTELR